MRIDKHNPKANTGIKKMNIPIAISIFFTISGIEREGKKTERYVTGKIMGMKANMTIR